MFCQGLPPAQVLITGRRCTLATPANKIGGQSCTGLSPAVAKCPSFAEDLPQRRRGGRHLAAEQYSSYLRRAGAVQMGKYSAYRITGVLTAVLWAQSATAADFIYSPESIEDQDLDLTLPAVSDINGKLELYGGFTNPGDFAGRAAGSLSLPVGDAFGLQFDGAIQASGAGTLFGGAAHAFTRDPSAYLLGVTAGFVQSPAGTLAVIGPEGELYLDRVSLEGWAGFAALDYDDPMLADLGGVFAIGDVVYYPTDDWRVGVGASYLLGEAGIHFNTEYLLRDFIDLPISLVGDARFMSSGAYSVMGGIKGYLGPDPGKSLIDRHRQDDPPNRALSLFGAAGSLLYAVVPPVVEEPEEPECPDGEIPVPDPEGGFICVPEGGGGAGGG
jgi:hypothetical protein